MSTNVLLEAYNAGLGGGTGIATYIRNLTEAAKMSGYTVDGLLHSYASVSRKDTFLSEVSFYDARNFGPSKFLVNVESNWRRGIGVPMGIAAHQLKRSGMIVNSGAAALSAVTSFDKTYVARMFMDFSRFHFSRYGTAARLKLAGPAPDLFHTTQMIPLKVPGAANIYTIHDLVPILLPYTTLDDKKFVLSAIRYLCKSADHIVTVSEQSKADIIALTGIEERRITNTYQSVTIPDPLVSMADDEVATTIENLFGLGYQQYFLFCGALEPKKNVSRLLSAYAASGTKFPLIIAGPLGWEYAGDLDRINDERFVSWSVSDNVIRQTRKVRRIDYLPYAQLITLMRGARALLFPSLYEGFGLPVLEAMSLGTPVVTSNAGSLAEVAGDAAILVNPLDVDAISKAIQLIDADADLRISLAKRGREQSAKFSPKSYREKISGLYRQVIGH